MKITLDMAAAITYVASILFLSAAVTAASETCDEADILVTTNPAPQQNIELAREFARELKRNVLENSDLLLIGDSLAYNWPESSFLPLEVANFGIGGDKTQQVLWRLSSLELSKLKPRKVLVIIGTNNLSADDKACAIIFGIKRVISRISEVWPSAQIGFLEIPPRGSNFLYKNQTRLEINAAIRSISTVKTINVDDAITCGWHEPCANYTDDNLHISEAGYQILAKAVRAALFQN